VCLLFSFTFCVTALAEETLFKVGVILPLSGPWAEFGEAQKSGFELARMSAPDNFRNIRFIYEDGEHQGHQTIAAYRKLRNRDNVNIVFVWGVMPADVIAPLAEREGVPLLVSAQVVDVAKGRKYVLRTINYS